MFMNIWRWSHSGQVCSGDFLTDTQKDIVGNDGVYLIFEGKFIKGILITLYIIFGMSCCSVIIVSYCVHRKHVQEHEKERAASGLSNGEWGALKKSRTTAFNKALDPDYEAAMRDATPSMKVVKKSKSEVT